MLPESQFTCIADVKAVLGEGPVWVEREKALYWVDIKGRKIFRRCADGVVKRWDTPLRVGSLIPRSKGGFVAGTDEGLAEADPEAGQYRVIANPEPALPDNRFNDAKVDRAGRLWAGTMDDSETQSTGALYRFDSAHRWTTVDSHYAVTNGPAFSPAGDVLYHNDSARQLTYAFDLDPDGNAANRRIFARYGEGDGYPDGMTVDREGCLWIAFWDGWCVRRLSPGGELLATFSLPVQRPTSCAFGGDGFNQLFVTSASIGLGEAELAAQPDAGGLFMLDAPVSGLAELPFAG